MRIEIKDKKNFISMFNEIFHENKISTINGITIDSRKVEENDIYFPIIGGNHDGHDYIQDVIKNGAQFSFSEKNSSVFNKKVILTKSINNLIKSLASKWQKRSNAKIIGITGSNGKTTTKELLYAFLSKKYKCSKTKGNFNSLIGLPFTFLNSKIDDDYCILEYGASKPNEIELLCEVIKPDYSLITNISESHISNYKSMNELVKTKTAIYRSLDDNDMAFINNDIKYFKNLMLSCKKLKFGFNNKKDNISTAEKISIENKKYFKILESQFLIPDSITHLETNILSAIIIADYLKIEDSEINKALKEYTVPSGRGNIISKNEFKIIDDCYNANPASVNLAIKRLNNIKTKGKKIFVFGDMLELGKNSIRLHQNISDIINESKIDVLFTYGEYSQITFKNIDQKKINVFHYKKDAFDKLKKHVYSIAKRNDTIYLKGSRSMYLERIYKDI